MKQKEGTEASAQRATNKMTYKKPNISYKTIRKNTNLEKFFVKKAIEEEEEETRNDNK